MSMDSPPPPYEESLPGSAVPTAPLAPVTIPTYGFEMYLKGSTAPSAPTLSQVASPDSSPLPGAADYWKHHRLHLFANLHQLYISTRKVDSYLLTDKMSTLLYTATLELQTDCYCCGNSPKGPGISWQLKNATGLVLTIHMARQVFCLSDTLLTTTVKMASHSLLGRAEGKGSKFTIMNPSGDALCYMYMEDKCCGFTAKPLRVTPAGDSRDVGEVIRFNNGFKITFPRTLDVAARAILTSAVISLQYHFEDAHGSL